ncbi:hypothetical protein EBU95_12620 [bacterium]|nr:hypothetical protein [bacterium]
MKKKEMKSVNFDYIHKHEEFMVLVDSGDEFQHEYTIKTVDCDRGVFHSIAYSEGSMWSSSTRGTVIYEVLNDGNGYEFTTGNVDKNVNYSDMFAITVFLNFIMKIESSGHFKYKICKITDVLQESEF